MNTNTIRIIIISLFLSLGAFMQGQTLVDVQRKINQKAQITNLPTLYIDTNNQPIMSKTDYVNGTLQVVGDASVAGKYNDSLEIRGRGNSTWTLPKKPYRMKLKQKYNLLGMPAKEKSWPILANYGDKSLMRNSLACEISRLSSIYYTIPFVYADVVINGAFQGNYWVTDQVEMATARVDVEKQKVSDTTLPTIEGGYLLEIDGFAVLNDVAEGALYPEGFMSKGGIPVSIKYPKDDEINREQRAYIIQHFNHFEEVLRNFKPSEPLDSVAKYLDIDGLINWYIATELTANSDCLWSIFMKKGRNGSQFVFGPLWDNDISFANDDRKGDTRNKLILPQAYNPGNVRQLINNVLSSPEVIRRLKAKWVAMYSDGLGQKLDDFIVQQTELLEESQHYNFLEWDILNKKVFRELEVRGSWEAEVAFLRQFMSDRVAYLNQAINNIEEIVTPFEINPNAWYVLENVANSMVVDLNNQSAEPLTTTVLWSNEGVGRFSQQYRFKSLDNGAYQIINRSNDLVLDAVLKNGGSPAVPSDYSICVNSIDESSLSQSWTLNSVGEKDVFHFVNTGSGMAMDNWGGASVNGNTINVWHADEANINQQWRIVKVALILLMGDSNNDGAVNISDVVNVVNYVIGNPVEEFNLLHSDLNDDNTINVTDVVTLINLIIGQ